MDQDVKHDSSFLIWVETSCNVKKTENQFWCRFGATIMLETRSYIKLLTSQLLSLSEVEKKKQEVLDLYSVQYKQNFPTAWCYHNLIWLLGKSFQLV